MKKLLLVLCALLTGVGGVKAQVSSIVSGNSYNIQFSKNQWYFSPTLKTTNTNPGTFRFDEVGPGTYTIYSVEEEKYVTRGDAPSDGGTPTLAAELEDTENFKWAAVYDGTDWRIKTTDGAFCLNGWTNTLAETNDVKFYSDATHDLASLKIYDANDKLDVEGKTFKLNCARGYIAGDGSKLYGTSAEGDAAEFAIVSYEGTTYLYDATNKAFVIHTAAAKAGTSGNDALESSNDFSKAVKGIGFGRTGFSNYPYYLYEEEFGNWLNMDGQKKVYMNTWTDFENAGGGNTYVVTVADVDFDATEALAALAEFFHPANCYDRVEANVLPFLTAAVGQPFGITEEAATKITTEYAAQLAAKQFSQAEYEAAKAIVEASIIYPEDGKYYFIKNVSNGKYLNVQAAGNGIYANLDAPTASSVVKALIRDGHTYFATQDKEFGWCYGASYAALLDAAGGGKYAHFTVTAPGQVAFAHSLGNGEGKYADYLSSAYYTVISDNLVAGGQANAAAAQWTFEETTTVDIPLTTVGDASYATAYLPFGVTAVENAKANILKLSADETYVKAEEITEVPAGTGIVLIGEADATTATLTIGEATASVEGNALTGHYLAGAVANAYVLANGDEGLGFYALDSENNTVVANRAYIVKDAAVKAILFGGDETGIQSLERATATDAVIYNVAGQRVSKAVRGLYIAGGKKVLVK